MNLEFIKPQNLGSLLMKSSQSNFDLRSPGSYSICSYLITTVRKNLATVNQNLIGLISLRPYETRNLTFSGMIDTPYYFVLNDQKYINFVVKIDKSIHKSIVYVRA